MLISHRILEKGTRLKMIETNNDIDEFHFESLRIFSHIARKLLLNIINKAE